MIGIVGRPQPRDVAIEVAERPYVQLALAVGFVTALIGGLVPRVLLFGVAAVIAIAAVVAVVRRPVFGPRLLIVAVPLLTGIPRGTVLGPFRASELLLVLVMGGLALAWLGGADFGFVVRRCDVAMIALLITGVVLPLLMAYGRDRGPGIDDVLNSLLLVKAGATYFIIRAVHRSTDDAHGTAHLSLVVASALSVLAFFDAFNIGGTADLLYRFMPSGESADSINDRRASATIGNPIGLGGYLVAHLVLALALLRSMASTPRRLVAAIVLIFGGVFLTGQISVWLAAAATVVVLGIHERHRLTPSSVAMVLAVIAVVAVTFFPIVERRVDGFRDDGIPSSELRSIAEITPRQAQPEARYQRDPGSSWDVRWFNLSTYFLPALSEPSNLAFGVRPLARAEAPEAWREWIWIESGLVWILYVGGIPLLAAYAVLLESLRRLPSPIRGVRVDALASAAPLMVPPLAVLMLFDPHLTMRGSADGFYPILALAAFGSTRGSVSVQRPDQRSPDQRSNETR